MDMKRIKELQKETAYPWSISIQQALIHVWNECARDTKELRGSLEALYKNGCKQGWIDGYPAEMAAAKKALTDTKEEK